MENLLNTTYFNSSTKTPNVSEIYTNTTDGYDDTSDDEAARMVHVIGRPVLVVLGTIGNCLAFYVMRKGSLKNVSTCFYMAILALADTGKMNPLQFFSMNKANLQS